MLRLHSFALGSFFIAMHRTNGIHHFVGNCGLSAVLGLEFLFEELGQAILQVPIFGQLREEYYTELGDVQAESVKSMTYFVY